MKDYFAFQWHILDECDQRCRHCYIFEDGKKLETMSFENMELIVENCLEMCDKTNRNPYFSITGGDPILHPDFWKLLELLDDKNLDYSVMGNPFHLDYEVCRNLKDLGCRQYQMSIDGLRKTHDLFRMPGSYDETLDKIKTLHDADLRVGIMTTVSKRNINQIPWIIDEAVRNKADVFSFARYCPTNGDLTNHISPGEYKQLLKRVWEKFIQYSNSKTLFSFKDHLWTLFLYENGLFTIPENLSDNVIYGGCNCANNHLTILPNADIYACRRMESRVGNALSERIFDVFNGARLNQYRRYEEFEKCRNCELLRFCRGCPAVSWGYTKNMYSADPQCWKNVKNKSFVQI